MSTSKDRPKGLSMAVYEAMREDVADALENSIGLFQEFERDIPDTTSAYMNKPSEIHIHHIPYGLNQVQLEIALQLWDIHSFLCSMLLTTIWRTEQLKESLVSSLNERSLIIGANAARALFETACAFYVESNSIITEFNNAKIEGINNAEDATKLRIGLQDKAIKSTLGTRQATVLKTHINHKRTNIQTLIDKALKNLQLQDYFEHYEKLCDAVHPSFESFSSFNIELGISESGAQMRWVMNRYAMRQNELIDTIGFVSSWTLCRLLQDFKTFYSVCIDFCLSARLPWLLEPEGVTYYGLCARPELNSPCPCGSGAKWKFCSHSLSSPENKHNG